MDASKPLPHLPSLDQLTSGGAGPSVQMTLELFWSTLEEQLGPLGKKIEEELIWLCLPDDPQYLNRTTDTVQGHSPLTRAEFHTWVARPDLGLQNSPCAVCYVPRATTLMIPTKLSCPPSWILEYVGYLKLVSKYRQHQGYLKCMNVLMRIQNSSLA